MDISRALKDNRLIKALTGLSIKEFEELVPVFERIAIEERTKKPNRTRQVGGGRKGSLKTFKERLFFILFYLKTYPTMDLAAFIFGVDKSRISHWVKDYLPLLKKALNRECVLPKRQINSIAEFYQAFPQVKDVFIDATEREINRPQNPKKQQRTYSGKKKQIHVKTQ